MKTKRIMKKLLNISNKHNVSNDNSYINYDDLGKYCNSFYSKISILNHYSSKNNLTWNELDYVQKTKKEIYELLETISLDKKIPKRYSSLIKNISYVTTNLYDTIILNNVDHSNFNVDKAIANGLLQDMNNIKKQEEKYFEYLLSVATSETIKINSNDLVLKDYSLLNSLKQANDLYSNIPNLQIDENIRSSLLLHAKSIKNTISYNVNKHYEKLKKIDEEKKRETPIVRNVVMDKLKEYNFEQTL